ncbi:MAG: acetylxylan esterase [Prevotella sp.]|nr:acetylxylan esterase [Prevotella sp.]
MKHSLLFLSWLFALTTAAQQFQQEFGAARKPFLEVMAVPDHPDSHYSLGEPASLRITVREGGCPLHHAALRYKVGKEMFLPALWDTLTIINGEAIIPMGTLHEPGFLACQWEMDIDGKRQHDATDEHTVTQLVRLRVGEKKWMYGYLSYPRKQGSYPVVLVPPGAGSKKIFPSDYYPKQGMIYLKIEIHDLNQLLDDAAYQQARERCEGYMHHGLADRASYYYKDVYVGCARAVDFLCSLPQWDGKNVIVTGGSQGGALTIITAALNERVTLCAPFYPALSDLLGFLHGRAGGWPKFFSPHYAGGKVDVTEGETTLPYYDVVNFARVLSVPTFMSWGYSDDTCSPTSVWAVWNVIKAPKESDITPTSGHWRFPSSQTRCLEWMKKHLR